MVVPTEPAKLTPCDIKKTTHKYVETKHPYHMALIYATNLEILNGAPTGEG